jgi:hypothetical protein
METCSARSRRWGVPGPVPTARLSFCCMSERAYDAGVRGDERGASSCCSSSPTIDGICNLPGSDDTTRHHSHRITRPTPDQRKRRLQMRNDNSHCGKRCARCAQMGISGRRCTGRPPPGTSTSSREPAPKSPVRRPHLSRSEGRPCTLTRGRPWWGAWPNPPSTAQRASRRPRRCPPRPRIHGGPRRHARTSGEHENRIRAGQATTSRCRPIRPPTHEQRFMRLVRAGGRPCRRCREPDQRPARGRLQTAGTGPSPARRREAGDALRHGRSLSVVHGVMVSAGRRLQGDDLPWPVGAAGRGPVGDGGAGGAAVTHWPCR